MGAIIRYIENPSLLRTACILHIENTITSLRQMHTVMNDEKIRKWFSLTEGDLWKQTHNIAVTVQKKSQTGNVPVTASFVEKEPHGRMIVITVAPWCSEKRFIGSLPEYSYLKLIRPFRFAFRDLVDWEQREFAHWIFLEGEDEMKQHDISTSLFYLWSFDEILTEIGRHKLQNPHEHPRIEKALILPTSILLVNPSDLVQQLLRDDILSIRDSQTK